MTGAQFRSAFTAAPVGMLLATAEPGQPNVVVATNDALAQLLGRPSSELVGMTVPDLVNPLDADDIAEVLAGVSSGATRRGVWEHRVRRVDGSIAWARLSVALAGEADGRKQLIGHLEDVTEHRRTQDEQTRHALYDGLTGLANRLLAMDQLRRVLAALREQPGRAAILYADLDRFKAVNDTYGRDVGDRVLVEVAARLRATVPHLYLVARLAGDEFLVVCHDIGSDEDLHELVERVRTVLENPVDVRSGTVSTTVFVGASIGVSVAVDPDTGTEQMLHEAGTAMREAKRLGRHRYQVFETSLGDPATRWLQVERDLRTALAEDRMVLHYQPIVDLVTGRISGVEALLRMVDPVRGLVPPGEFIDVAEESALTYPLGDWVVNEACRQLAVWQEIARSGPALTMAVNVTGRQAAEAARSGSVLTEASTAGIEAGTLFLEVTERTLLGAADDVVADLEALTRAGVRLTIDDFGTGYSSLTYLQRFPVHTLKIDQSFVAGLGVNRRDDAIVAAVVALGAALGLEVVAEGVETAEQQAALQALGCPAAQGYFLGRPMPADDLSRLLVANV
ncbi:MAG: EAL domain-containing protein [Cellulomonas sp.]|nr:EAL domain-containing protein [Cellulomonas sp.]